MRDVILRMSALAASAVGSLTVTVLAQTSPDSLSGSAGWASFGIAGLVLAWLFWVHLPAKDRQAKEALELNAREREATLARYDTERDAERKARHERQDQFQQMMNKMAVSYEAAMKNAQDQHNVDMARMQEQHLRDANADREAFVQRQDHIENMFAKAIQAQTMALELSIIKAVQGVCKADCNNFRTSRSVAQQDQT